MTRRTVGPCCVPEYPGPVSRNRRDDLSISPRILPRNHPPAPCILKGPIACRHRHARSLPDCAAAGAPAPDPGPDQNCMQLIIIPGAIGPAPAAPLLHHAHKNGTASGQGIPSRARHLWRTECPCGQVLRCTDPALPAKLPNRRARSRTVNTAFTPEN